MPTQHSWVVHSWLSDCFYYLLWLGAESIAPDRGERALALFRFVLFGVFVLVAYTWARRSSQNETLAVLVTLCAATLTGRREVGPLLFTPLLFLYVYSFCRRREPMKLDWFLLPFLMLLWANVHGGFAMQEIRLSWSVELLPARYLGELVEYGTEFLIMPVGDRQPEWEMLAEKGVIEFLHKNQHNFLACVNVDKVREVYAGTRFGAELPQEPTRFR